MSNIGAGEFVRRPEDDRPRSAATRLNAYVVTGVVEGRRVAVGNLAMISGLGVALGSSVERAESLRVEGHTVMFIAVDGTVVGLAAVCDPSKASTLDAMPALRAEGLRVVMLTSDDRTTAEILARKLGVDEVMAEVPPGRKADAIARLQAEGRRGAMAGGRPRGRASAGSRARGHRHGYGRRHRQGEHGHHARSSSARRCR